MLAVFGGILVALWGGYLVVVDCTSRRLPDVATLPAALFAAGWAVGTSLSAIPAGLFWPVVLVLTGLASGGSRAIGGGDVKLAVSLGIGVALYGGLWAVIVAMAASSMTTAVVGAVLRKTSLPHGPSMLLGAAGACAWVG